MPGTSHLVWTLTVQVKTHKEGNVWVATCPALDVASQGQSKQEACAMLEEALILFLETCHERGTLSAVLDERGLVPKAGTAISVQQPAREAQWLQIPVWILPGAATPRTAIGPEPPGVRNRS